MADNEEITTEATGSSRRALLAKAAAAGAVVYTVPMMKSIPAYAAAGFDSYRVQSGTCCVWFSPNQNNHDGTWHADIVNTVNGVVAESHSADGPAPTMNIDVKVDGTNRGVTFAGDPNNIPGSEGKNTTEAYFYHGGGVAITSQDSNCEIVVEHVVCRPQKKAPCDPTNETAPPTTWAQGSSDVPIGTGGGTAVAPGGCTGGDHFTGTVYYHTGRTGGGENDRCKLGILFRVRCK
ncbi:MAG: hypothetical protein F2934_01390 [Actinobacteria bacterium]|uniref:Unannotated protein n=1 Tax=freshwater metagenome TaxID=449393 RepID=A0A6J7TL03_9ZZZZ|nr:hypothetical protein [Actinomycetota bacterium]MTB05766.1 hypothetical protein [Actinomycetota bacterium]